ncbi:efflux RND transporter periplasmic adaptor subunit [Lysobacter capsici]|uniref:efflux RND transporter periplasmic adaptor subunit n=1 Tax=Lysobacter capsici TaxID=435897 RepID=UPI001C005F62|nr:HlyD family efflux transporter periplasmic adaptor subunit [Lysobacter capsici]QWF19152.1 HlyD family efflux transporter periplasmic adaptor subunit [Lysobacter capsici]
MDVIKPKKAGFMRKRSGWWLAGGSVALVAVSAALMGLGEAMPSAQRSDLWIDAATRGDMVHEIRATGTLVPRDVRWITAATAGTVQEVLVLPGARVGVDTLILRLGNPAAMAALEKARASLAGADADVAAQRTALQSQLLDQEATLTKAESVYQISKAKTEAQARAEAAGASSKMELRQSQITLVQDGNLVAVEKRRAAAARQNFDAQMRAAQAKRDEVASAFELARQDVAALEVRAGIDGILQQMDVEPGQQVPLGTSLARVARQEVLIARLQVPEVQAKDLSLDLPVQVDTHNGVAEGRITRIDPAVKEGRVTVDVGFARPLPSGARPDLSVDGRIVLARLHDVLSIGRAASATPQSGSRVFVLAAGSDVARRVQVAYGRASGDRIEVRSGLRPGDQVILSETSQWDRYDTLKVR